MPVCRSLIVKPNPICNTYYDPALIYSRLQVYLTYLRSQSRVVGSNQSRRRISSRRGASFLPVLITLLLFFFFCFFNFCGAIDFCVLAFPFVRAAVAFSFCSWVFCVGALAACLLFSLRFSYLVAVLAQPTNQLEVFVVRRWLAVRIFKRLQPRSFRLLDLLVWSSICALCTMTTEVGWNGIGALLDRETTAATTISVLPCAGEEQLETKDLLGGGDEGGGAVVQKEIDLDVEPPQSCGWEKRLDLQSGKVYFHMNGKDKNQDAATEEERNSCSSSSRGGGGSGVGIQDLNYPPPVERNFLGMDANNINNSSSNNISGGECQLELKLSVLPAPVLHHNQNQIHHHQQQQQQQQFQSSEFWQSVCTLDKVKMALQRAERQGIPKRKHGANSMPAMVSLNSSAASELQSNNNNRNKITSHNNNNSSSSTTFRSSQDRSPSSCSTSNKCNSNGGGPEQSADSKICSSLNNNNNNLSSSSSKLNSNSNNSNSLLAAGCSRCLLYVLLPRTNPKCPRCGCLVVDDFFCNSEANKKLRLVPDEQPASPVAAAPKHHESSSSLLDLNTATCL